MLVPSTAASLQRVRKRLDKHADLPMDFADATLVALAEELDCTSVFTTDRTDFPVYRLKGRKSFRLVPTMCESVDQLLLAGWVIGNDHFALMR